MRDNKCGHHSYVIPCESMESSHALRDNAASRRLGPAVEPRDDGARTLSKYFFVFLIFVLAGCSLSPVDVQPLQLYTLDNSLPKITRYKMTQSKTLLVATPEVSASLDTDKIAVSLQQNQLSYLPEVRWAATPAQMILPLFTQAMDQAHLYKAVVSMPYSGLSDVRLDTQIQSFKAVLDTLSPYFEIQAHAQLLNQNNGHIIKTQSFEIHIALSSHRDSDIVNAANLATQKLIQHIVQFCA